MSNGNGNGGLLDSKTNKQILIGSLLCVLLVAGGIAVEVLTERSVFEYIALGVTQIFGGTGLATWRNVKTDAPIRLQEAALDVAIKAKEEGVAVPVLGPVSWTPPPKGGAK